MDILRWEGKLAKKHGLPVYQKVNAGSGAEDRYFIRLKTGKLIPYARFLWNEAFPEDVIRNDEEIHHKDFNPLNNSLDNLEKLTPLQHRQIHVKGPLKDNIINFNLAVAMRRAIENRQVSDEPRDVEWNKAKVWSEDLVAN